MKNAIAIMKQSGLIVLMICAMVIGTVSVSGAYLRGDVDGDNRITLTEALHSLQVLTGLRDATAAQIINVPADIPTIQQAIDAAAEGDTIRIAAGSYNENLVIHKDYLRIEGDGRAATTLSGGAADTITIDGARGVHMVGFTVDGGSNGIRSYRGATFILEDVTVQNAVGRGIWVGSNCMAILAEVNVTGSGSSGIRFNLNATGSLRGTVASDNNGGPGLEIHQSSSVILEVLPETAMHLSLTNNGNVGLRVQDASTLVSYGAQVVIRENQDDGVQVLNASSINLGSTANWRIENGGRRGLMMLGTAQCQIGTNAHLTIDGNKQRGIHLMNNSGLFASGTVTVRGTTEGDGFGILVDQGSSLYFYLAEALIENNQGVHGDGIHVRWGSSISIVSTDVRQVTIRNNQRAGISLFQHSQGILHGPNIAILNNVRGLFADDGSSLQVDFATISGNSAHDVHLRFGARGTFTSIPDGTMQSILCEQDALSRGVRQCP